MDRTDRTPADPPWEALEALAAGELPPEDEKRLREQLAVEPGWQQAWREVSNVESLLRAEPLLALPLSFVRDAMAAVVPLEREKPWRVFARVAAAVLVFCASWFAFSGQTPALADAGPRPELVVEMPELAPPVTVKFARSEETTTNILRAGGGLLLVVAGVVLARRWNRAAVGGTA